MKKRLMSQILERGSQFTANSPKVGQAVLRCVHACAGKAAWTNVKAVFLKGDNVPYNSISTTAADGDTGAKIGNGDSLTVAVTFETPSQARAALYTRSYQLKTADGTVYCPICATALVWMGG